jgi:endoglucanase
LWNGVLSVAGNAVTVRNEAHNWTLAASASTTFGFTGSGAGAVPADIACS